ncbi:MAG: polyphosphate polymerase domain-containing protein [Oscillospiraceae bacterium]|nr:polyphosphate polymerase domain-containing protein [Oscillospiraceae bacterium]
MNQVLREEKKFLINIEDFLRLSHKLEQVLIQDEHNGTHGYIIRSLYFDTIYDQDYFEKAAGTELRRKIRLRIYDPAADFAMLEMKQKQGNLQRKRSLRVTREDGEMISRGDYSPLLKYEEPFAAECYAMMNARCYRPVTIVEYHRKAFIAKENKIRVTFDNQIVATESCFDVFSPRLNMNPVLDKFDVVLEVKYNGFLLDYIRRLLNDADRSELSVSKYVLARQTAYQTHL